MFPALRAVATMAGEEVYRLGCCKAELEQSTPSLQRTLSALGGLWLCKRKPQQVPHEGLRSLF